MKVKRNKTFSGAPWESLVGYSRARSASAERFMISGSTGTDDTGQSSLPGNLYEQAVQSLKNIEEALKRFGLSMDHVVRTRIYVTDISQWKEVARAHAEVFGEIHPATTLVGIHRLVDPEMLVEIEAIAVN